MFEFHDAGGFLKILRDIMLIAIEHGHVTYIYLIIVNSKYKTSILIYHIGNITEINNNQIWHMLNFIKGFS